MTQVAIVEDEEFISMMYRDFLEDFDPDIQVDEFRDQSTAAHALASKRYDLIVMDLCLKVGLKPNDHGGVGLMVDVAKHQHCPVVVVTGLKLKDLPHHYRDLMQELQAFDFLEKPVGQEAFTISIRKALRASREMPPATPKTPASDLPVNLLLDPLTSRYPSWKNRRLILPPASLRVLYKIARQRGQVTTFRELAGALTTQAVSRPAIRAHVHKIRNAFRDVDPRFDAIKPVPDTGYIWQE